MSSVQSFLTFISLDVDLLYIVTILYIADFFHYCVSFSLSLCFFTLGSVSQLNDLVDGSITKIALDKDILNDFDQLIRLERKQVALVE